jgi:alkanesulfonate monooxygenase SsuD/methylene tetrahydromethanopterin reductase-like flavin-dependent oxidoreductase (luciferase family)
MRISFSLPYINQDGTALNISELMGRARAIEAAGFDGIWISDTVARGRDARPDPLMYLVAAAAATSDRIELGTAVLQVPLRNPVELAQRVLTLHALSGGRFCFGVGAGSSRQDFESVGGDYERRFQTLNESLATIRSLCKGETVGSASLHPWPNALGGPPILIGSWASALWIKRAAREFDGWLTSGGGPGGTNFRNLKEGIKLYRAEGGRRAIVATVGVDLTQESPPMTDDSRFTLRCSPEEAIDRIERVRELGYDDVLLRKDDLTEEDVRQVASVLGLGQRKSN